MSGESGQIDMATFDQVEMRVARVVSAPMAEGTHRPSRVITLDVGELGTLRSVAQLALVEESELVGANVVACVNLGTRQIGRYVSEALVLGATHPENPEGGSQAMPLMIDRRIAPGSIIY